MLNNNQNQNKYETEIKYEDIFESNPDTLLKVAYVLKDVLNARSELEKLNKQGEENNEIFNENHND